MNIVHKELAAGRWAQMSFPEQMANIGSEVSRALNWQKKGNEAYMKKAVYRALELIDLTLKSANTYPRLREVARVREALVDFFFFENEFSSTEKLWRKYFDAFAIVSRNSRI